MDGGDWISIHAFRGEGDPIPEVSELPMQKFQSTPSVGKATPPENAGCSIDKISIHAFRGEGDSASGLVMSSIFDFNPRLPWGRRLSP